MKIISWNLNGIRSAARQGMLKWFDDTNADIVCFQELKSNKEQVPTEILAKKYCSYFNTASTRKGYSGVAILAKTKPRSVKTELGHNLFDQEGRYLELDYEKFKLINIYLPHGGRDKSKLPYKLEAYRCLRERLLALKGTPVVILGDFNVAHHDIDLARPKQNTKNIMFTPEERGQIDQLESLKLTDSYRALNKNAIQYTWWPWLANARQRNIGWRIDYIFVSNNLRNRLRNAAIYDTVKGSDHCPVGIEINLL